MDLEYQDAKLKPLKIVICEECSAPWCERHVDGVHFGDVFDMIILDVVVV